MTDKISPLALTPPFWLLVIFLVVIFAIGGASRGDVTSLVVLRPFAVLVCGIGLLSVSATQIREYKFLFLMFSMMFALVIMHLVPLPPAAWHALPGRETIITADQLAGLSGQWRPITLTPGDTLNALFAMFIPLAVLILSVQLSAREKQLSVYSVLGFAIASGMLGFLQIIGPADGPFYFYEIQNVSSSTGLLANRNHQALLLSVAIPALALASATDARSSRFSVPRRIGTLLLGIMIIPLLLITGSRAGLALGLFGFAIAPLFWGKAGKLHGMERYRKLRYVAGAGAVIAILLVLSAAILFARAEALTRLLDFSVRDEVRLNIWGPLVDAIPRYLPFGSGIGSFSAVYKSFEPTPTMSYFYMNHAHNELLEIALTGGLPAIALAVVAFGALLQGWRLCFFSGVRATRALGISRLGVTILTMVALSSLVDYPLRVPSIAAIAMLAAVWAFDVRGLGSGENSPNEPRSTMGGKAATLT